jgi:methyltransferase (TIGR00027 family)
VRLPDLSYMMTVAGLRYIQSIYEPTERRNPDRMVRELLTPWQRAGCIIRGSVALEKLRAQPFYYYVLARTRYYDGIYLDAVSNGVSRIVNIGAGSDTRAYRFADELKRRNVRVLECDQLQATRTKERAARRRWHPDHVEYLPLDLNDADWPALRGWFESNRGEKTLVLMEGVSPYIDTDAFGNFLKFLSAELAPHGRMAYDFKIPGVDDEFGRSERTLKPFRFTGGEESVAAYHSDRGYRLESITSSADLSRRLLPSVDFVRSFEEDVLVQLSVNALSR